MWATGKPSSNIGSRTEVNQSGFVCKKEAGQEMIERWIFTSPRKAARHSYWDDGKAQDSANNTEGRKTRLTEGEKEQWRTMWLCGMQENASGECKISL